MQYNSLVPTVSTSNNSFPRALSCLLLFPAIAPLPSGSKEIGGIGLFPSVPGDPSYISSEVSLYRRIDHRSRFCNARFLQLRRNPTRALIFMLAIPRVLCTGTKAHPVECIPGTAGNRARKRKRGSTVYSLAKSILTLRYRSLPAWITDKVVQQREAMGRDRD